MNRRAHLAAGLLLLSAICGGVGAADTPAWVATWAVSDMAAGTGDRKITTLENFTLRQVVRITAGGDGVRVRISNVFGDRPLLIGGATVALRGEAAAVLPATLQTLRFGGAEGVSVAAGEFLYSDPVALQVDSFAELATSLYFPEGLPAFTRHGDAALVSYVSESGNFVASATLPVAVESGSALFLTGVEVANAASSTLIVCFGDSITAGAGADKHASWPTRLAERLAGAAGVINQSISGSRFLHDYAGESALKRFERDALSWVGVDYVIVAIGINDLRYPVANASVFPPGVDVSAVSADAMIAGFRQLIALAQARGIAIVGTTITPFEGGGLFSEEGEAMRVAINQWIRESNEFDAVIDFDAILRDSAQPSRFAAQFHDDDDWLHPNAAGYRAMADSIDLTLFATARAATQKPELALRYE